jgi:hypothetical protein
MHLDSSWRQRPWFQIHTDAEWIRILLRLHYDSHHQPTQRNSQSTRDIKVSAQAPQNYIKYIADKKNL